MPSGSPNYLTADANGDINAVFPGGVTIHEDQVDEFAVPSTAKSVKWIRTTDQSLAGYVAVKEDPGTFPTFDKTHVAELSARHPDDGPAYNFNVSSLFNTTFRGAAAANDISQMSAFVTTRATGQARLILKHDGTSDYVQKQSFIQQAYSTSGIFPGGNFTLNRAGPVWILWTQTGYVSAAGGVFSFTFSVDGVVRDVSSLFYNLANVHTLHPVRLFQTPSLAAGVHTCGSAAGAGQNWDANDFGSAWVFQP